MSSHFHGLLLTHLPRLHRYARSLTRSAVDAEDLTQTAVLKILKFESRYEQGTNFAAWSRAIMRNSLISEYRKARYRRAVSLDAMLDSAIFSSSLVTPADQEEQVLRREVRCATSSLQPRLLQTLMLVGENELSYEQVAIVMSCSVGTVKSRLWRARARMKALLETPARTLQSDALLMSA
jgi:RNA polymerase sigma-70 factor, ECF subfamily